MIKTILSYLLVFLLGIGVCYLWIARTNPKVAGEMLPSFGKKATSTQPFGSLPRPKALNGTVQSIKGQELEVVFTAFGQTQVKKVSLKNATLFVRRTITEKERLGKYYDEYLALQTKMTSTMAIKDRQKAIKSIADIRMKSMQENMKMAEDLNDQLAALKPEQAAEREALSKKIEDAGSSSHLESVAIAAFQVGDRLTVYLANPEDIDQGVVKPQKVEIIR